MPSKKKSSPATKSRKPAASKTKKKTAAKTKATTAAKTKAAIAATLVALPPDPTVDNLKKIEHLVVLMMENRSFDHMLGYLKLVKGRTDIDGLEQGMMNKHNGQNYPVHHLETTALTDAQDPAHHGADVVEQLSNNNGGFVSNFAKTHTDPQIGVVMGYYDHDDLPVYDHLAQEFCICDRWFAPVPGATWPNRLYAVTGRADKSKDNKKVPLYNLPSFVRHLDEKKVSWRWYAYESLAGVRLATVRLIDGKYRLSGNYSKVESDFLVQAAQGKLPAVSWLDPNFVDFGGMRGANDDHPPADVMAGQDLVLKVYNALVNSPQWSKTLFVIAYDEHGGFYDHVAPPGALDDNANFRSYGVRVPALLVSPWLARGSVAHTLFDHTSIIKTILLRFCRNKNGTIPNMGLRVTAANHLGGLLTEAVPRPPLPMAAYQNALDRVAAWHSAAFKQRMLTVATAAPPPPSEFQQGLVAASKQLAKEGAK